MTLTHPANDRQKQKYLHYRTRNCHEAADIEKNIKNSHQTEIFAAFPRYIVKKCKGFLDVFFSVKRRLKNKDIL